jgi:tetratricopeptide (TPR) repeat protein
VRTDEDFSEAVWALLQAENYPGARAILERELRRRADDHWLLTRIGLTYYEERRYGEALQWAERALASAPRCPLVLWDLAGTHQMLGNDEQALRFYRRLLARGVQRIAHDECGEGVARARALIADTHFRCSLSLSSMGRPRAARNALDRHIAMRGPGCPSLYPLRDVKRHREELNARPG